MKRRLIFWGLLLALTIIVIGCTASEDCEPVVIVSNTDYTYDPLSVPYTSTHEIFANTYSGADLSFDLRTRIIDEMWRKAERVNEDPQVLYQCIKCTYPDWHVRPNRIPCYAEKCRYQGQTIWAIAFNRANSFEEETLSHFDLYFVSYATYDTLYHTGCFGVD
jgi:hypothetical protein